MSILFKKSKRRRSRMSIKEERTAYLYLIPAFMGLTFITYLPLLGVFGISFFEWKGISAPRFNGLDNYIKLFTRDHFFIDSIKVTVYFSLIAVLGSMIYSLFIAMLLNRKIPARGFSEQYSMYRTYCLQQPYISVGHGYMKPIWSVQLFVNKIGLNRVQFLASSKLVVPSLAVISVWLSGI